MTEKAETSLNRRRGSYKKQINKFVKFVNELETLRLSESSQQITPQQLTELEDRIARVETSFNHFEEIQTEIELGAQEDQLEQQYEIRDNIEETFLSHIAKAKYMLLPPPGSIQQLPDTTATPIHMNGSTNNVNTQQQCVNLPKIELPKFSGSYFNWLEFHDTFDSLINKNDRINNIDKFHYLKSSLSGEAAQVIKSIELAASNYDSAWKLLCDRFNNTRLLLLNHTRALFNVEQVQKESATKLRKLNDDVSKHLNALKALGEPTESWDTLIIYLITSKLDSNTLKEWEEFRADLEQPKLNDLRKFLLQRANMLETLEMRERRYVKPKETRALFTSNTDMVCPICNDKHYVQRCNKLLKLKIKDRIDEVKKAKLCSNCLKKGHLASKCKAGKCRLCNEGHNTLLHIDKTNERESHDEGTNEENKITSAFLAKGSQILLSTVCVEIHDKNNKICNARAVLDSGSQSSFITEELCRKCDISIANMKISVSCLNNTETTIRGKCVVGVKAKHEAFETKLECLVMKEIAGNLPNLSFDKENLNLPENINLADPSFNESAKVDILIGADQFWNLIGSERKSLGKNKPVLIRTKFGWIISGPLANQHTSKLRCNLVSNIDLQEQLTKFWKMEECDATSRKKWTSEENECEDCFIQTTKREPNGRFVVRLPLKTTPEDLGQSLEQAKRRFFNLEKKLHADEALKLKYVEFMQEYHKLGHMSKIRDNNLGYYIPHHCVLKDDSLTTKLRVVFDASARTTTGHSLNDIMKIGPNLQDDLVSILLRFREHKYVISADITKMYRQVLVTPQQRDLQKILWRDNQQDELGVYQLNTVTYGTAAASFLAIRSLRQVAQDIKTEKPNIANIIERDFYVDDLLTGSDSEEEAANICKGVKEALEAGCFPLRKFCSNESNVLKHVTQNKDEMSIINLGVNENTKTLGLIWCPKMDQLSYNSGCAKDETYTKRSILATTAQIFDPLGLLSPCIIIPKLIIQQLWLDGLSWDEEISEYLKDKWREFKNELNHLNEVKIPRHVKANNYKRIELHGFADASQRAYGGCIYVRTIDTSERITIQLLYAKAKVAPLKTVSIPRLELCGALILARLMAKVKQAWTKPIEKCVYWTDSTILLGWLKMPPRCLKTFVSNRIVEIQDLTSTADWKHVVSKDNPADILSRGTTFNRIQESELWWHGPKWLGLEESQWPHTELKTQEMPELLEKQATCILTKRAEPFPFERFSSLQRLTRSVAYILRFKTNCLAKGETRQFGPLDLEEVKKATATLIKIAQQEVYGEEIRNLQEKKQLPTKSDILCLKPFLDDKNILRIGGRITNSNFDFKKKHPIILPRQHYLTKLIFKDFHLKLYHAAPQLLLANLREEYWPISGRNTAKYTVRNCIRCFRCKPRFIQPSMGDLPKERITPCPPFAVCGVDYMGPLMMKDRKGRGCKTSKCYVSLFVCFTTKAIHAELVTSLTKDAFIMALRRFAARRGKPTKIYSDNGTNFVAANNELKNLTQFLKEAEDDIKAECTKNEITWEFIPPHSPHFGGLWEAGVKSVKHHLKRVMGETVFTYEELYTLLVQIEAILNSRPLSPLSANPEDLNPLTPGHFLVGRPLTSVPDANCTDIPNNRLSVFQNVQFIQQLFWKRWSLEYIAELQQRNKWKTSVGEPKIGDLVIIKDDNLPPMRWKLGRIVSFCAGKDGVKRVVILKTQSGIIKRAVKSMCVLPLDE